jgi:hypothetical protein
MSETSDPLAHLQARRYLEEINHFILHGDGEIVEAPGKISLVWEDPGLHLRRFLAVKAAGIDQVLINGRLFPATEVGLQRGLVACLSDIR